MPHFQLIGLSPQQQEQKIAALINDTMLIPFDYERGPLLQLALLTLAPQKHLLALRASPVCLDTASLAFLMQEIGLAYALRLEKGVEHSGDRDVARYEVIRTSTS